MSSSAEPYATVSANQKALNPQTGGFRGLFSNGISQRWPLDAQSPVLGRVGSLEVRLARNLAEIREAQALRYQVFFREMAANPGLTSRLTRRDRDGYDRHCDHLLVVDTGADADHRIVATYRMLPQERAERGPGFYTQAEFDISGIVYRHPNFNFLEMGRSCVLPDYRNKKTMGLLWQGIWGYINLNNVDVLLGCASFPGTDPVELALPLSFLHHFAGTTEEWRTAAQPHRAVPMDRIAKKDINQRQALRALPPLVKGYLRLGAHFGEHAVIDPQFGTTDVLIVMPKQDLSERYVAHYGAEASRIEQ